MPISSRCLTVAPWLALLAPETLRQLDSCCTTSTPSSVSPRPLQGCWQTVCSSSSNRELPRSSWPVEVPAGLAILRFRAAIWSDGLECYLAELYVVPAHRRQGLGKALMTAAIQEARQRGADIMDIGVDEPDIAARHLYKSLGFTNRAGGAGGPLMYVYEREL